MIFKLKKKKIFTFSKFSLANTLVFKKNSFFPYKKLIKFSPLIVNSRHFSLNLVLLYWLQFYLSNIFFIKNNLLFLKNFGALYKKNFQFRFNGFLKNKNLASQFYSENLRLLLKFYNKQAYQHYRYYGFYYRSKNFQKMMYLSKAANFYFRRKYYKLNPNFYNYFRYRGYARIKRQNRKKFFLSLIYFAQKKRKLKISQFLKSKKKNFIYFKINIFKKKLFLKQFNDSIYMQKKKFSINFWETLSFYIKKKKFSFLPLPRNFYFFSKKIKKKKTNLYSKNKVYFYKIFSRIRLFNQKLQRFIFKVCGCQKLKQPSYFLFLKFKQYFLLFGKKKTFLAFKRGNLFIKSPHFFNLKVIRNNKNFKSINRRWIKKKKSSLSVTSSFVSKFSFSRLLPFLYFLRVNKYRTKFKITHRYFRRKVVFKQTMLPYLPLLHYRRSKFFRFKRYIGRTSRRFNLIKINYYKMLYKKYFITSFLSFIKYFLRRAQYFKYRKKNFFFFQLVRSLNKILQKQINLRFFYRFKKISSTLRYLFRIKRARRLKSLLSLKFKLQAFFTQYYPFKTNKQFFNFLRIYQFKLSRLISSEIQYTAVFKKTGKIKKILSPLVSNFLVKLNFQFFKNKQLWLKKKNKTFYFSYKLSYLLRRFLVLEKTSNLFFFFFKKSFLYQTFLLLEAQVGILLYRLRFIPFLTLIPKIFFYNLVTVNHSVSRNPFFILTLYDFLSVPLLLTKKLIFYHFNGKREKQTQKLKYFFKTLATVYNPFLQKIWLPAYLTYSITLGAAILHSLPNIFFFLSPFNRFSQNNSRALTSYYHGSLKTTKIRKNLKRKLFQRKRKFQLSQHFSRNFCLVRLNFFSYLNYYTKNE